jgi:poly-beta-1,6-N-acetyl-D-glucosamine synthase
MAIDPSVRARVFMAGLVRSTRAARRRTDRGAVVALIEIHDEEEHVEVAIRSLKEQKSPPNLIIVCADNCTYRTAELAEAAGAHVFETVDNAHKKAGALNQALDILVPELHDEDAVLVINADAVPGPSFLSEAMRRLREGIGGVFRALKADIKPTAAAAVRTANLRSGPRAGAAGSTTAG